MDRKWMFANRLSDEYAAGVKEFVKFAVQNAKNPNSLLCPCLVCWHGIRVNPSELEDHLICKGIDKNYICWSNHGESRFDSGDAADSVRSASFGAEEDACDGDRVEEMAKAVEDDLRDCPQMFERLKNDAGTLLYNGCSKFTRLSAVLKLYNLKAANGWTDTSFTNLLTLLKDMLPEGNVLPGRLYEAKQMLCSIGMSYERIHACPNDCILFRNEYESLKSCPKCKAPRYKKENSCPLKVLWYFPIIPRFRRMYRSAEVAKQLTWHKYRGEGDGMLRHPADSPQWSKIDSDYSEFGKEERNLRLALSTDGINPHSLQSSTHSTWPVILVIYNLPPWLCMKRKYMMLSMLISGPQQPGNDIDIYLSPLIEDLKKLWEVGVEVYDGSREETFRLRAMLFGTINDFPAYGNLSGYSVKGKLACPICEDDTISMRLDHCKKNVFLGHRRFLRTTHRYRGWTKAFNGNKEEGRARKPLKGSDLIAKVKNVKCKFGKTFKKQLPKCGWKKKSIFFELPYWESLHVRHFLDVMHIEKNVFESVIGTLLNVPGKTKDSINARLDLVSMGIRKELRPVKKGKRTYLPPAAYTLSRKEKIALCKFLSGVKVPHGYSSNIKNLVSMKDLKLKGLKTHDCHVLMENLLPVALRSILPEKVRDAITRLCLFFKAICSKVIDPSKLSALQRQISTTLCDLEMYFPPSFFDIMVHLTIHLVREIQMCGPTYMRWMYPFERYMKVLKGYVKNRSRPEGCMVERYVVEEAIEFCTEYLSNVESIGLPKSHHTRSIEGEGLFKSEIITIQGKEWQQAHLYVLHNAAEVGPYVDKHKEVIKGLNLNRSDNWLAKEHNRTFIKWLKDHVYKEWEEDPTSVSERLKWLSRGPSMHVFNYNGYVINDYTFYTEAQDDRSTMQNSGVTLVARSMHVSSAKDRNPIYADMSYFGVIQHIWELDYTTFQVPVFGCKWVDNNSGVQIDDSGFIQVDLNRVGFKDDPFILASQAEQIFYVPDPANNKRSIVSLSNKINVNNEDGQYVQEDNAIEDDPFFGISQPIDTDSDEDDSYYVRDDHDEGIWMNIAFHNKIETTRMRILKKRKRTTKTS
ncbi:uncharacterized protein LOC130712428 [Lotus japonicus]|uniref:uncharacterized protein LOC130712428 n=1 Tax=Lotus japonicus TaxID=34305 RepID=UPI0025890818|nr:uncharacterized protein LOC130712428 [Lotus japonicus]